MKKNKTLFYTVISLMLFSNQSFGALNMSKEFSWNQNNDQNTSSVNLIPLKTHSFFHDEVIATFVFEQYSDELLLLTATVEKNHFIHALKTRADCTPKDMMQVCGSKCLKESFEVKINDQEIILMLSSFNIIS